MGIIACIKCMWCVVSDFKDHNILSICTSVSENPQFCNSTCIVRWAFQLNCSPAYGLLRISSFHPVEKQTKLPKHIGQTHILPMSVPGRVGYIRNHNIQHVETYVLFELRLSCLSASNVSCQRWTCRCPIISHGFPTATCVYNMRSEWTNPSLIILIWKE